MYFSLTKRCTQKSPIVVRYWTQWQSLIIYE